MGRIVREMAIEFSPKESFELKKIPDLAAPSLLGKG
jgi:hypothetical protein